MVGDIKRTNQDVGKFLIFKFIALNYFIKQVLKMKGSSYVGRSHISEPALFVKVVTVIKIFLFDAGF